MPVSLSELLRIDPLTECKNYLGFLETLVPPKERSLSRLRQYSIDASNFSALFFVDMNDLRILNETKGLPYGDSALRWMGILLREECDCEVYRVGGDEFAILLKLGTRQGHLDLVERIHRRMKLEAEKFGFPGTAADTTLIFFGKAPTYLDTILLKMAEAMAKVKNAGDFHVTVSDVSQTTSAVPESWKTNSSDPAMPFSVRWISLNNIHQVLKMGMILDETQHEAYTDTISGMPNLKAALLNLENSIQRSLESRQPFCILMIDGDNIRAYNSINYAAGDEMIRKMCAVYRESIRPNDFAARWRSGDEFLIILPDTPISGAKIIAERIRAAVREASRDWRFPVTVSIGIACCPDHGETIDALIDTAELANKHAKDQGKDRVVVAD